MNPKTEQNYSTVDLKAPLYVIPDIFKTKVTFTPSREMHQVACATLLTSADGELPVLRLRFRGHAHSRALPARLWLLRRRSSERCGEGDVVKRSVVNQVRRRGGEQEGGRESGVEG